MTQNSKQLLGVVMGDDLSSVGFYSDAWFKNKKIICSKKFKDKISGLLSWKISKIIWDKDKFLIFSDSGSFSLMNREGMIVLEGSDDIEGIDADKLDWNQMLADIFFDSKAFIEGQGRNISSYKFTEWYHYDFGKRETRFLFMAPAIYRTKSGWRTSIVPKGGRHQIMHADFECIKMSPDCDLDNSEIDSPCDKKPQRINEGARSGFIFDEGGKSVLYDNEIILGGLNNLRRAIQYSNEVDPSKEIVVHSCCTPLIMGEDVTCIIDSESENLGKSIVYNDVGVNESEDKFLSLYLKDLKKMPARKPIKQSINLIGYECGNSDLKEVLSMLDISINQEILPEMPDDWYLSYRLAELQVLFQNHEFFEIYRRIFYKTGVNSISPQPPYGFKATNLWVKLICRELGVSINSGFKRMYKDLKSEYDVLRSVAKSYKIGFILNKYDVDRVIDPSKSFMSIPVLQFVKDMGFELDVCIYCRKNEYLSLRTKLLSIMKNISIRYVADVDELDAWLKSDISIIFSDYKHDRRITRYGKSRFSLALPFLMGYSGAIETCRSLLKKCSFSFSDKFKENFGYESKPIDFGEVVI